MAEKILTIAFVFLYISVITFIFYVIIISISSPEVIGSYIGDWVVSFKEGYNN